MKKIVLLILFLSGFGFAQSAGNTGLAFLKHGFGARNIAMGDLGVAGIDDLSAFNYNPAQLAKYKRAEIIFNHNEIMTDVRSETFGAGFKLFGLPFALGVNTTSVSDIEIRNTPGDPASTFNANYFYTGLATGFFVSEDISVGLGVKYLYEGMLTYNANGYALDFGVNYYDLVEGLELGLAYRNIGSMNELKSEATKLPGDLRFGAAYGMDMPELNGELLVVGGYQKYTDTDDNHIHAGTEFVFKKLAALRLGYQIGYESKGFSGGLGVYYSGFNFDYAFVPFQYDLGSSHIISIKYNFM
ncbi:MAG: hypothetical protein SCALA702_12410 [Melioribacteraceae bacterium]|nr:MAG: hypothetical protein SCALA702_12410 [Melioribacteraceae bacterium]